MGQLRGNSSVSRGTGVRFWHAPLPAILMPSLALLLLGAPAPIRHVPPGGVYPPSFLAWGRQPTAALDGIDCASDIPVGMYSSWGEQPPVVLAWGVMPSYQAEFGVGMGGLATRR